MQRVWRLAAISAACWLLALWAWSGQQEEYKVTLNLVEADLRAAIQLLTQRTNVQVVFKPTDKPYAKITLNLTDQPFETALKYICQSAGATYRRESDGVYVIGPEGSESESSETTPQTPPPVQPVQPVVRPQSYLPTKIQLKYSNPKDIVQLILWERKTDDPFSDLREFMQKNLPPSYPNTVHPSAPLVNYPSYPTNPNQNPNNPGEPRSDQPDIGEQQFRGGGFQRGGGGLGGGFGQPGGPGGGLGGGLGQPGGGLGQPGGGAGNPLLPPEGQLDIIAIEADNSLIVRGPDENVDYIKRIIRMLDIAPKQVEIRAEFVTVGTAEINRFGIDWNLSKVNLTAGATGFAVRDSQVFVNWATGNLVTALRAQLTADRAKIVNAPIITTMNNTPATLITFEQSWVVTQQVVVAQNGQPVAFSQPFPVVATTLLQVTPRINADGTITMVLTPQVQEFRGTVATDVGDLPILVSQSVLTVRRMKNGETVVIGGLIRRNEQGRTRKIPILADLPIVGQFFRSKDRTVDNSELLIFITATVLPDPVEPGGGTFSP